MRVRWVVEWVAMFARHRLVSFSARVARALRCAVLMVAAVDAWGEVGGARREGVRRAADTAIGGGRRTREALGA